MSEFVSAGKEGSFQIIVHEEKCSGCGNCIVVCPPNMEKSVESGTGFGPRVENVVLRVMKGVVKTIDPSLCNGCGNCVITCPTGAIEIVPLKPIPAQAVFTVGEAPPAEIVERVEVERPIEPEEVPFSESEVRSISKGIDLIYELLKSTKVRFFIELGRLQEAREEIAKKLRELRP